MSEEKIKKDRYCSFCGKHQKEVKRLIFGSNTFICNECVDLCNDILKEDVSLFSDVHAKDSFIRSMATPSKIKEHIDQYVVGQDEAKQILSVAIYNHYKRIHWENENKDADPIQKSNILLIGPSGTGKTYIAQIIAKFLSVPIIIADATTMTESGYVGDDVESCLSALYAKANYDLDLAQRGIVVLDELCKIARKSEGPSLSRDVSGEGVQQALLKLIEGSECNIVPKGGRKHPQSDTIKFSTKNVLFICCGAFDGLDEIIKQRLGQNTIGFGSEKMRKTDYSQEVLQHIHVDDLIQYGIIPELVGRLPVVSVLHPLGREELLTILSNTKNCLIEQYQRLFDYNNVQIDFEPDALIEIVDEAIDNGIGARGLRSIMERVLLKPMYEIPDKKDVTKVLVTKDFVTGNTSYLEVLSEAK